MKKILFFAFLSTFTIFNGNSATVQNCAASQTAYPPEPESNCCGILSYNKIIRGKYTAIDQYPWLALIEYDTDNGTKFLCGGTLISSRYVLTAAHCVTGLDLVTPKSIRLGEYDASNDGFDCEDTPGGGLDCADPVINIPIEEVILHPTYDLKFRRNDIALIRLKTPSPHTDFIQPICLPTADFTLNSPNDSWLWIAGWGASRKDNLRSNIKQQINIPYVTKEVCQPIYNVERRQISLWEKQICAGGKKDKDSCNGDSGGPLMSQNPKHLEIVGILSFENYDCGAENVPAVYTKVFEYKDWIQNTIKT